MDQIDEFESMFRRAEREAFAYAEIPVKSAAIITDGSESDARQTRDAIIRFLPRLETIEQWQIISGDDYANVGQLMQLIDKQQLDLIVTFRHLQEKSLVPQHSLGVYLDVLTQVTSIPVLVLPGTAAHPLPLDQRVCNRVMVVTDHISGDNRLINYGVRMCGTGGTIWLCHIEDDAVFERYIDAIGRIPEIDSDQARTLIDTQLLKEAGDFIETCINELREEGPNIVCHSSVSRGHHLREYRKLIDDNNIDLLIANTNDADQMAMHGITYSLSVELTDVAMLLL